MTRKLIGYVGVDAGLMYVGDPCYIAGRDAILMRETPDWGEFYRTWLDHDGPVSHVGNGRAIATGYALGITVRSGHGDGTYPVYAEIDEADVVHSVTVEFIPPKPKRKT